MKKVLNSDIKTWMGCSRSMEIGYLSSHITSVNYFVCFLEFPQMFPEHARVLACFLNSVCNSEKLTT